MASGLSTGFPPYCTLPQLMVHWAVCALAERLLAAMATSSTMRQRRPGWFSWTRDTNCEKGFEHPESSLVFKLREGGDLSIRELAGCSRHWFLALATAHTASSQMMICEHCYAAGVWLTTQGQRVTKGQRVRWFSHQHPVFLGRNADCGFRDRSRQLTM